MSNKTVFAVPKERQDVTVRLDGTTALNGSIFLEFAPEGQTVLQKIVSFLDDGTGFFPLVLKDTGMTEFIRKRNIRMIELKDPKDEEMKIALALMQSVSITAIFTDDSSISGSLLAEVPAEKARLSDCLNLACKFMIVKVDGKICYVNKDSLRKVVYGGK